MSNHDIDVSGLILDHEEALRQAEVAGVPEYMVAMNMFKGLLSSPVIAGKYSDLLGALYYQTAVSDTLRELIILRIAWITSCEYVWSQHVFLATEMFSLEPHYIQEVRDPMHSTLLNEMEKCVLDCVDSLVISNQLSRSKTKQLLTVLGDERTLYNEIMFFIANWSGMAAYAKGCHLQSENPGNRWPPDGVAPTLIAENISEVS